MFLQVILIIAVLFTQCALHHGLWVCIHVLFQLVLFVEAFVTHGALERAFVHHAMLDEIRTCRKFLVTLSTRIWAVAKVQILMLHENMFVAEAAMAYVALVRFFADMRETDMPDEAVLVAKVLIT